MARFVIGDDKKDVSKIESASQRISEKNILSRYWRLKRLGKNHTSDLYPAIHL